MSTFARKAASAFVLAAALLCGPGAHAQTASTPPKSYQFINGQWFDGTRFRRQVLYSVDGTLTRKAPAKVDEVLDLSDDRDH